MHLSIAPSGWFIRWVTLHTLGKREPFTLDEHVPHES